MINEQSEEDNSIEGRGRSTYISLIMEWRQPVSSCADDLLPDRPLRVSTHHPSQRDKSTVLCFIKSLPFMTLDQFPPYNPLAVSNVVPWLAAVLRVLRMWLLRGLASHVG